MNLESLNRKKANIEEKTGLNILTVDAGEYDAVLLVGLPAHSLISGDEVKFKARICDTNNEGVSEGDIARAIMEAAIEYQHRVDIAIVQALIRPFDETRS